MDTGGLQGVILPNLFQSPGEALQQGVALNERRRDRDMQYAMQERERQQRQQQQNRLWNLNQLNEQTGFDRFKTGQQRLDDYVMGELNKIKSNALSSYINLDPAEMQYRLTQDMQNISQWDAAAKTGYKNLDATLDDFTKMMGKNVDANKARSILESQFVNDVMQQDENGNIIRKNPQDVKFTNYADMLNSPDVAGQIVTGISPILEDLQKSATTDINPKYKREVKGKYTVENYKGKFNPVLQEISGLPDKQGYLQGTPQINFKTEKHGNVEMMPQEQFEQTFMSDPVKAYLFKGDWQRKKQAIEQASGVPIPEGSPMEDYLKRGYGLKIAKDNVKAMLNPDIQQTQAPILTRIELGGNINGRGSGSGDASNVNDVYKSIDDKVNEDNQKMGGYSSTRINSLNSDAQNVIMDFVKKTTGNDELNYSNVFLHKNDNGDIGIYSTTSHDDGKADNVPDARHLIGYLPKVGTNLKVQPSVKEKREVISQGNQTTQPHTTGKKKIAGF